MSLKRYKLLITLVLPLLFLSACADKSVEVANNTTVQTASKSKNNTTKYYDLAKDREYILPRISDTNIDPLCQIYVDALNTYGTTDDFFQAPIQPNSPEFGYPKWEQLDIYENWELYRKAEDELICFPSTDQTYRANVACVPMSKQLEARSMINFAIANDDKTKEEVRKLVQMYYTRADIDNDGAMDDIIRIDTNRYSDKEFFYISSLTAFEGEPKRSFASTNGNIDRALYGSNNSYINNFFFYKGKTYMKSIFYNIVEVDSPARLYIYELSKAQYTWDGLCWINAR